MIRLAILTTLISFAHQQAFSQKLDFKVIDYATEKPLGNVEVFSHEEHGKVSHTDKQGLVNFDIDHTDTLIFFKQGYTPLYIQIHRVNFDHSHALVLKMKASSAGHVKPASVAFDELTKSKYTFVHDSLENSSLQVTHFEVPGPSAVRYSGDKSFHIVQLGIEKKNRTAVVLRTNQRKNRYYSSLSSNHLILLASRSASNFSSFEAVSVNS